MHAIDPEDGRHPGARGGPGREAPGRPVSRPWRLLLLDDVLDDEDCEALVRIAAPRAARLASSSPDARSGARPVHVPLSGPDLDPYEAACRDHVEDRLQALFDWPREAGRPLHLTRLAGAWPGSRIDLPAVTAGGEAVAALLLCWLRVSRHGAWLRCQPPGLTLAGRRGAAVLLRPPEDARSRFPIAPSTPRVVAGEATWIATQCLTRP